MSYSGPRAAANSAEPNKTSGSNRCEREAAGELKQFKVVLGTVDCRQLCRTKKKIGRNRCECEAAGELEQAQPQRLTHKQDIHHTNEPRKQFKLKSPLSVTDRGEIQLEFQTRASTQRRGQIHNRMSPGAAATNKALGHHDGCCPARQL